VTGTAETVCQSTLGAPGCAKYVRISVPTQTLTQISTLQPKVCDTFPRPQWHASGTPCIGRRPGSQAEADEVIEVKMRGWDGPIIRPRAGEGEGLLADAESAGNRTLPGSKPILIPDPGLRAAM